MKTQNTLLFALATAAIISAAPVQANPVFYAGSNTLGDTGLNDIEILNRENLYRSSTTCTVATCMAFDVNNDPTGYQRVIAGTNLAVGDLFIGVLQSRQISSADHGVSWNSDSVPPGIDEFTGYFAQEIKDVQDVAGGTQRQILLGGLSVADPFSVLNIAGADGTYGNADDIAAGWWASNTPIAVDGALNTTFNSIATATDGTLWAYLGLGADTGGTADAPSFDGDGYAWSNFDLTAATFTGNAFVAYNLIMTGAAFNIAKVDPINDPAEALVGGALVGDPATTALNNYFGVCVATATYACNDIVGNTQLSANQSVGPWAFASEDPMQLNSVPEPATIGLLGIGLLGMGAAVRRRRS